MTISTERQRRIERMLIEQYEAEGYRVIDDNGSQCALVKSLVMDGLTEFSKIDLSDLAEKIERNL